MARVSHGAVVVTRDRLAPIAGTCARTAGARTGQRDGSGAGAGAWRLLGGMCGANGSMIFGFVIAMLLEALRQVRLRQVRLRQIEGRQIEGRRAR